MTLTASLGMVSTEANKVVIPSSFARWKKPVLGTEGTLASLVE